MKTSHVVEFYIYVLGLVAAIEAALLGYLLLLLYPLLYPYHFGMNKAWPGLLLLTTFLLVTLRCIVYEFRFLRKLRTNPNAVGTGAKVAFWLGLTPLLLFAGVVIYGVYG